jgi:hypothetical protein
MDHGSIIDSEIITITPQRIPENDFAAHDFAKNYAHLPQQRSGPEPRLFFSRFSFKQFFRKLDSPPYKSDGVKEAGGPQCGLRSGLEQ